MLNMIRRGTELSGLISVGVNAPVS